jgi:hypothetical protein
MIPCATFRSETTAEGYSLLPSGNEPRELSYEWKKNTVKMPYSRYTAVIWMEGYSLLPSEMHG